MFNVTQPPLQIIGVAVFGIGVWAWQEKDTFNNLSRVAQVCILVYDSVHVMY